MTQQWHRKKVMSIHIGLIDLGLFNRGLSSASEAVARRWQIPLLVKVAVCILLGSTLLTIGIMSVSRTATILPIKTPPQGFFPSNPLPSLSENISCNYYHGHQLINTTCLAYSSDQNVYFYSVEGEGRKGIVRTTISANEYTIGALMLAWGTPTGFDRYGTVIVVSWGTRSALLVTSSFQPTSRIGFITYDLEAPMRSPWRGFGMKFE
jgi:hypothetical protein